MVVIVFKGMGKTVTTPSTRTVKQEALILLIGYKFEDIKVVLCLTSFRNQESLERKSLKKVGSMKIPLIKFIFVNIIINRLYQDISKILSFSE